MVKEGFGVVPGRSRDKAKRILEAAEKAGVDGSLIRTTSTGYEVPLAALDAYEASVKEDGEPVGNAITPDKGSNPDSIPPLTAEDAIKREQGDADADADADADGKADAGADDKVDEKADDKADEKAESKPAPKTQSKASTKAKAEGK